MDRSLSVSPSVNRSVDIEVYFVPRAVVCVEIQEGQMERLRSERS